MKRKYSILAILILLSCSQVWGQNTSDPDLDKILFSIKKQDVENLAIQFNNVIELTVPGSEGNYSKTQAKYILKDFFGQYPPIKIEVKHKGSSKKGSKFAISHYHHKKGKLRLYFLIKEENNKYLIHILRFEEI